MHSDVNMFRSIIVFATLVNIGFGSGPTLHSQESKLDEKIVGGTHATIEQYPYQLSLQYFGSHICGASIISANKALTAAHCTDKRYPQFMTIRAGSTRYNYGGQLINIKSICQHPRYNSVSNDNDISVLTLSSNIKFGPGAQPINLMKDEVPVGAMGTVTGWGTTNEKSNITSNYLRKVNVPRIKDVDCQRAYWSLYISSNMICFGYRDGNRDSCQGDSGGPIVINDKQVGVVSWGVGCAQPGNPGVYTKVSNFKSFIDRC